MPDYFVYLLPAVDSTTQVLRDVRILSTAGRSSEAFRVKMLPIYGYGVNVNRFCH